MLDRLATGLRECKNKQLVGPCLQLDSFFDSMLHSRISRRIMAEQHLHISTRRPGYIGIVSTDLNVREAIEFAAQKTRQVCTETFGVAPEVVLSGDTNSTIQYIPVHLDYMLFELLKNAARVRRLNDHSRTLHVRFCSCKTDVWRVLQRAGIRVGLQLRRQHCNRHSPLRMNQPLTQTLPV